MTHHHSSIMCRTAQRQRAFSLTELVVSMSMMTVLFAVIMSSVLLASKALPDPDDPLTETFVAGQTAEQLLEDLQDAIYITESTSASITFVVADRDGNGTHETIRYAWGGTDGDPLTRQYNDGNALAVVEHVQQFALGYLVRSATEEYVAPDVESAETLLSAYKPPGGAVDGKTFDVLANDWPGQFFQPSLPADVLNWRLTRVSFRAAEGGGPKETIGVRLYAADPDGLPTGSIIDESLFPEHPLTAAYAWHNAVFADGANVAPRDDGFCVVFANNSGVGVAAKLRYDNGPVVGEGRLETQDAGSSYSYDSGKVLMYEVYGTTIAANPTPQTVTRQFITGVDVILDVTGDASSLSTSVNLPNAPEVLSAMWESRFYTDPEHLDINADGAGDWNIRYGGTVDPNNLAGGVWQCDGELDTVPDNDFTEITTVDLRYRATGANEAGAYLWMNADYTGGKFIPIVATLKLLGNNTQQLQITAGGTTIVKVANLTTGFITLRLLIDPGLDTINVKVDGVDHGTHAYTRTVPGSDPQRATLFRWSGSAVEYDYVRIRVGGISGGG